MPLQALVKNIIIKNNQVQCMKDAAQRVDINIVCIFSY